MFKFAPGEFSRPASSQARLAFARCDDTLSVLAKTSELTHSAISPLVNTLLESRTVATSGSRSEKASEPAVTVAPAAGAGARKAGRILAEAENVKTWGGLGRLCATAECRCAPLRGCDQRIQSIKSPNQPGGVSPHHLRPALRA
jgi:hypothetical protein